MLMVSMSSPGEIFPSTWMTSGSVNTRTTWQMASLSRMAARNLLPRPSPTDAPLTIPAMSTKVTMAGTISLLSKSSARRSSRSSGTATTPTLGSMVANG